MWPILLSFLLSLCVILDRTVWWTVLQAKIRPGLQEKAREALGTGQLDSISALSPRQPTLRILADLPFAHPVQAHSIIANRDRPGPVGDSSDGVVPYRSSHLEGVASELIVPANHWAYRHPAAIAEIKRILNLKQD